MAKARLDLGHGFVKSIIKNQVDRDNYDKEIKSSSDKPKQRPIKKKERRPDIITYVLPKDRTLTSSDKQVVINCNNAINKDDRIIDTINGKTSGDCSLDDLSKVTMDFRKKLNFCTYSYEANQ